MLWRPLAIVIEGILQSISACFHTLFPIERTERTQTQHTILFEIDVSELEALSQDATAFPDDASGGIMQDDFEPIFHASITSAIPEPPLKTTGRNLQAVREAIRSG